MATFRPFQSISRKKLKKAGFTLIETLVVMTIVGVLSAILIGYSRQSSKNLALVSTEAKVLSLVSRAKFLSIETFFDQLDNPPTEMRICAYGIHINMGEDIDEIFIYQDRIDKEEECTISSNYKYEEVSDDLRLNGELDLIKLDKNLFSVDDEGTNFYDDIAFEPPDPDVYFSGEEGRSAEAKIKIGLVDGSNSFTIFINNGGQIRTE